MIWSSHTQGLVSEPAAAAPAPGTSTRRDSGSAISAHCLGARRGDIGHQRWHHVITANTDTSAIVGPPAKCTALSITGWRDGDRETSPAKFMRGVLQQGEEEAVSQKASSCFNAEPCQTGALGSLLALPGYLAMINTIAMLFSLESYLVHWFLELPLTADTRDWH